MRAESLSGEVRFNHLGVVDLPCSWCGSAVRLFDGDYSGVCIDCGTVMFRKSVYHDGLDDRGVSGPAIIETKLPPPPGAPVEAA